MEDLEETVTLKLSKKELGLIQYWRESCHHYNDLCPLHCVQGGTDACHLTVQHITAQVKEQVKEKKEE